MNVFYLDKDPVKCAQYHCDKHVVKMITEYAQLLSSAHRLLDGEHYFTYSKNNRRISRWSLPNEKEEKIYSVFGRNHPITRWVCSNIEIYTFLYLLFVELEKEYEARYGRVHKAFSKTNEVLSLPPKNISVEKFFEPPLAMPDYCKIGSAVESYREYYRKEKAYFAKWNGNIDNSPEWFNVG